MMAFKVPKRRCGNCHYFPGNGLVCPYNTCIGGAHNPVRAGLYACNRFHDKKEDLY